MSFFQRPQEVDFLKTERIKQAFKHIDRADFVRDSERRDVYKDIPLPIGHGQTISQPQVVAFMLELLSPEEGDNVLDIGFGSGWTTALLGHIVDSKDPQKKGRVIAIEKIPEIYEFGKENIEKYGFLKSKVVEVFCGDGRKGKEEFSPFDKILISAADSDDLPSFLKEQLAVGGRAVIPIRSSIFLFVKERKGFKKEEYPGFSFVPLV